MMNSEALIPELLSPAGNMESLKSAIEYGADAIYIAGKHFGMRTSPSNFSDEELLSAVQLCHNSNVKVYITCNTIVHNNELAELPDFLKLCNEIHADALIVADIGVMDLAKKYAPDVAIHISTQAGVTNYNTARVFGQMGADRIVLARELSLNEIREIREHIPDNLQIEAFVHGAMCVSFSGRCLLSSYLTGRDSNRGDCAQPCRWKYSLTEENRPGQKYDIEQEDNGTYIMNSKDMCMIEHLEDMIKNGISSLKIEGRAKSAYYVAAVTNAYRNGLDYLRDNPGGNIPDWIIDETKKVSHRQYCTGFYYGSEPGQNTEDGGYIRGFEVIAVCESYNDGVARLQQRNKFYRGDTADILEQGAEPFNLKLDDIYDENMNPIESAPHAAMTVFWKTEYPIKKGAYLRVEKEKT
jgi:putative protease